jgi:hypothetical protein
VFANATEPLGEIDAISPDRLVNDGSEPVCPIKSCPSVPRPRFLKGPVPEPTTIP